MAEQPKTSLNEEQQKKALEWLNTRWVGSKTCPISGHADWTISDHVVQPMTHLPLGHISLGGAASYPGILVICKGCGYTMTFNAVIMGLVARVEKAPEQEKEAADAKA